MKKRILSILLALSMVVSGVSSLAVVSAEPSETFNVTVKAETGGKVSKDGTNWSDSVTVPVAGGATLGESVQYQPDEGYKLDSVTTTTVIKKVVAAATCTAAIDDAGNLYTAGDNWCGQLGRKLGNNQSKDSVLTKVDISVKVTDVAVGLDHIVILDENGDVWTAGGNQYGALGTNEYLGFDIGVDTFKKVPVGDGSVKITAVAAGQYHTILVDENGGVWTAGQNSNGALGREPLNQKNGEFKKAEGLDGVKIVSAAGGTGHTILLDDGGNVWTAGSNVYGELGRQTTGNKDAAFAKVTGDIADVKITAIAAGSYHSVLLDENGTVWTVGSNLNGELGREDSESTKFKPADLQGATAAKFIAAAGSATVVIDTDGNARTCGVNSGHLGRTVTEEDGSKLLVAANGIDNAKMAAAAMGTYNTILLDENGGLWTCGKNQGGQLCRTENFGKFSSVITFAAVTDGMTQTITLEEMKNTVITSGRAFTITSAERGKVQLEYDLNGGSWVEGFTPRDFAYTDETPILHPDPTQIVRQGYTFVGWGTADPTANPIKYSAAWSANVYNVTFDANGGEVSQATMAVTYDEPLAKMPVPVRAGYIFGGWYDKQADGKQYGDEKGNSTASYDKAGDCTLYAMWTECDHAGSTAQPTCTDSAACTLCGGTIAALGHDFSVRQNDADEHWYKCSRCDATDSIEPHDWDSGTITTPATCTTAGEKLYKCTKCSAEKTETLGAKGHNLVSHAGQAATCTEKGWEKYYTCADCSYTTYQEIPATGNHTYEWMSEDGQYWQKCKVCHGETAKKAIPALAIIGAEKVCRTQDYTFGFVLPEGCKLLTTGYEFELMGSELEPTLEDGTYTAVLGSAGYPAEESSFKVTVTAETEDGFTFRVEKTVTILNEHTGGTATCKDKAVCEVCGEEYGELDPKNHTDLKHVEAKAATKTAEGNIEYWYCDGCGKYYSDAAAEKEITQADTVTAKLPDDPKTGDSGNMLWLALLLASGCAAICTAVIGRKKHNG